MPTYLPIAADFFTAQSFTTLIFKTKKYRPDIILTAQRDFRIRNRAILILLFPVTSFLFAAGWLLQYFGESQNITRALPTTRNEEIPFQIASTEEFEEYEDKRPNIRHH